MVQLGWFSLVGWFLWTGLVPCNQDAMSFCCFFFPGEFFTTVELFYNAMYVLVLPLKTLM